MKNIFLITKREYLTQVKKKSFIVLTLLAPLLLIGFGALIAFMFKANETTYSINVVDKSGVFAGRLKSDNEINYVFVPQNVEPVLKSTLKDEDSPIDGLLVIPQLQGKDYEKLEKETQLLTNKKIGFDSKQKIARSMSEVVREEKIKELGLSDNQIKDFDKKFELNTINVIENKNADSGMAFGIKSGLSMMLMYVIFMFIVIYGVRVMRSVLEEKNNRVVEIIISSVKPFELMMGKILGVTFVALTQFVVWIGMSVASALVFNTGFSTMQNKLPEGADMSQMNIQQIFTDVSHVLLDLNFPLIIGVFIFFFLLGYIFYSSIYAAIGSAVDNETETQQFTLFAILPLTLGMYGSFTVMNNPDGPLAFWLSIIPFTSPVTMVARIPFGVPAWQILLSATLLLISVFFMVFIASKIYRVGILMYGNKATLKELWRWIRS